MAQLHPVSLLRQEGRGATENTGAKHLISMNASASRLTGALGGV